MQVRGGEGKVDITTNKPTVIINSWQMDWPTSHKFYVDLKILRNCEWQAHRFVKIVVFVPDPARQQEAAPFKGVLVKGYKIKIFDELRNDDWNVNRGAGSYHAWLKASDDGCWVNNTTIMGTEDIKGKIGRMNYKGEWCEYSFDFQPKEDTPPKVTEIKTGLPGEVVKINIKDPDTINFDPSDHYWKYNYKIIYKNKVVVHSDRVWDNLYQIQFVPEKSGEYKLSGWVQNGPGKVDLNETIIIKRSPLFRQLPYAKTKITGTYMKEGYALGVGNPDVFYGQKLVSLNLTWSTISNEANIDFEAMPIIPQEGDPTIQMYLNFFFNGFFNNGFSLNRQRNFYGGGIDVGFGTPLVVVGPSLHNVAYQRDSTLVTRDLGTTKLAAGLFTRICRDWGRAGRFMFKTRVVYDKDGFYQEIPTQTGIDSVEADTEMLNLTTQVGYMIQTGSLRWKFMGTITKDIFNDLYYREDFLLTIKWRGILVGANYARNNWLFVTGFEF